MQGYDAEVDVGWSRYIDANISTEIGFRFADVTGAQDRAFVGIRYRLPYMIGTSVTADSRGDFRLTLMKDLQLTDRLELYAHYQYDTNTDSEWMAGFKWTLTKQYGLTAGYDSDHGLSAGLTFSF